jgi:hypothetical protein
MQCPPWSRTDQDATHIGLLAPFALRMSGREQGGAKPVIALDRTVKTESFVSLPIFKTQEPSQRSPGRVTPIVNARNRLAILFSR